MKKFLKIFSLFMTFLLIAGLTAEAMMWAHFTLQGKGKSIPAFTRNGQTGERGSGETEGQKNEKERPILILISGHSPGYDEPYGPKLDPLKVLESYLSYVWPKQKFQFVNINTPEQNLKDAFPSILKGLEKRPDLFILFETVNEYSFYPHKTHCSNWRFKLPVGTPQVLKNSFVVTMLLRSLNKHYFERENKKRSRTEDTNFFHRRFVCAEEDEQKLRDYQSLTETVVEIIETNKIPALFVTMAHNQVNFTPNFSEYRGPFEHKDKFNKLYQCGRQYLMDGKVHKAKELFSKAHDLAPNFAENAHALGTCFYKLGQMKKAKSMFEKAWESDLLPLVPKQDWTKVFRESIQGSSIALLDTASLLEKNSSSGLLDGSLFADMIHLNKNGINILGKEMAQIIAAKQLLKGPHNFFPNHWTEAGPHGRFVLNAWEDFKVHYLLAEWFTSMAPVGHYELDRLEAAMEHLNLAKRLFSPLFLSEEYKIHGSPVDPTRIKELSEFVESRILELRKKWQSIGCSEFITKPTYRSVKTPKNKKIQPTDQPIKKRKRRK